MVYLIFCSAAAASVEIFFLPTIIYHSQ
jgi:hypothetical protein